MTTLRRFFYTFLLGAMLMAVAVTPTAVLANGDDHDHEHEDEEMMMSDDAMMHAEEVGFQESTLGAWLNNRVIIILVGLAIIIGLILTIKKVTTVKEPKQ